MSQVTTQTYLAGNPYVVGVQASALSIAGVKANGIADLIVAGLRNAGLVRTILYERRR